MITQNLIPSWLTSWVAWRNYYTEPGKDSFNLLKEELGLDRMPTESELLFANEGACPFCHGDYIVYSTRFGLVYCLCKVLEKVQKLDIRHKAVQTRISPARIEDIVYPSRQMGGQYVRTMKEAVKEVESFIKYPDHWLYLYGYFGIGKTHLLRAINTVFGPMALYISAGELEQMVHSNRKEDTLNEFYDTLVEAPILIIDDVGMEHGGTGSLVESTINKIVDARYERWPEAPTVVASNKSPDELKYDNRRTADRILDKSRSVICHIETSASFRDIEPELLP